MLCLRASSLAFEHFKHNCQRLQELFMYWKLDKSLTLLPAKLLFRAHLLSCPPFAAHSAPIYIPYVPFRASTMDRYQYIYTLRYLLHVCNDTCIYKKLLFLLLLLP